MSDEARRQLVEDVVREINQQNASQGGLGAATETSRRDGRDDAEVDRPHCHPQEKPSEGRLSDEHPHENQVDVHSISAIVDVNKLPPQPSSSVPQPFPYVHEHPQDGRRDHAAPPITSQALTNQVLLNQQRRFHLQSADNAMSLVPLHSFSEGKERSCPDVLEVSGFDDNSLGGALSDIRPPAFSSEDIRSLIALKGKTLSANHRDMLHAVAQRAYDHFIGNHDGHTVHQKYANVMAHTDRNAKRRLRSIREVFSEVVAHTQAMRQQGKPEKADARAQHLRLLTTGGYSNAASAITARSSANNSTNLTVERIGKRRAYSESRCIVPIPAIADSLPKRLRKVRHTSATRKTESNAPTHRDPNRLSPTRKGQVPSKPRDIFAP
jgi:hypothetical protein